MTANAFSSWSLRLVVTRRLAPTQGRPRGSVSSYRVSTRPTALSPRSVSAAPTWSRSCQEQVPPKRTRAFETNAVRSSRSPLRPLLVLGGIGAEQLHLDVALGIELELLSLDRVADGHSGRREIDDDGFVALNQTIREQLVWTGIELEVLERIHVQADRERGEECRCLRFS